MEPSTTVDDQLEAFTRLVEDSPHNLVSKRARDELRSRHVPECVALAGLLPAGAQRVLDVGSGGGFPGVVLAIVRPELDVHLLDSTQKKVSFLQDVGATLDLAVTVHRGRAETLAKPPLAASFDVVTARAVAPLDRLIRWTVPFLRIGGLLYAVKGERWQEELTSAEGQLRRSGARLVATPDEIAGATSVGDSPRVVMIARDR
jgi:16S rRNA (guanine527-N7)-methyltransferase